MVVGKFTLAALGRVVVERHKREQGDRKRALWSSRWLRGGGDWDWGVVVDRETLLESGYLGARVNRAYA